MPWDLDDLQENEEFAPVPLSEVARLEALQWTPANRPGDGLRMLPFIEMDKKKPSERVPVDDESNPAILHPAGFTLSAEPLAGDPNAGVSHPPLWCKEPDWTFFDGYISGGGDISVARMTVEEAKRKAERMKGCKGFCFLRPETTDPNEFVEIHFKRKWDNAISKPCWTSFKLESSSGTCEFCGKRCTKIAYWLDHIKGNLRCKKIQTERAHEVSGDFDPSDSKWFKKACNNASQLSGITRQGPKPSAPLMQRPRPAGQVCSLNTDASPTPMQKLRWGGQVGGVNTDASVPPFRRACNNASQLSGTTRQGPKPSAPLLQRPRPAGQSGSANIDESAIPMQRPRPAGQVGSANTDAFVLRPGWLGPPPGLTLPDSANTDAETQTQAGSRPRRDPSRPRYRCRDPGPGESSRQHSRLTSGAQAGSGNNAGTRATNVNDAGAQAVSTTIQGPRWSASPADKYHCVKCTASFVTWWAFFWHMQAYDGCRRKCQLVRLPVFHEVHLFPLEKLQEACRERVFSEI